MKRTKSKDGDLSLLDPVRDSLEETSAESSRSQASPIVGISRHDALLLLDSGLLIDPRLRREVPSDRSGNLMPMFPGQIELWFENEVQKRSTEFAIGLTLKSTTSARVPRGREIYYTLAVPFSEVESLVFRTNQDLDAFRDGVETMQLSRELNEIEVIVDAGRFGGSTEDAREVSPELSEDQIRHFEKILRMTSAIAVSVCARRLRRGTSHAMRLLKGLPRKSPISERDNDTPIFDAILAHRWQAEPNGNSPVERLIYKWSEVIMQDDDLAPASLSELLGRFENEVKGVSELELFEFDIQHEIAKIRDVVAGLSPFSPLALNDDTSALSRVLGALSLFIMRRSPVDLLEMPRKDHLATEGVFMLAAYWSGLSTRRTRLDKRLVTGALREVLTNLEVKSVVDRTEVLPQAPLAYQISVEESQRGRPFDLLINQTPIAQPFGASWRVERDQSIIEPLGKVDVKSADLESREEVIEYLFSEYDVTISSLEGKVIIRKKRQSSKVQRLQPPSRSQPALPDEDASR